MSKHNRALCVIANYMERSVLSLKSWSGGEPRFKSSGDVHALYDVLTQNYQYEFLPLADMLGDSGEEGTELPDPAPTDPVRKFWNEHNVETPANLRAISSNLQGKSQSGQHLLIYLLCDIRLGKEKGKDILQVSVGEESTFVPLKDLFRDFYKKQYNGIMVMLDSDWDSAYNPFVDKLIARAPCPVEIIAGPKAEFLARETAQVLKVEAKEGKLTFEALCAALPAPDKGKGITRPAYFRRRAAGTVDESMPVAPRLWNDSNCYKKHALLVAVNEYPSGSLTSLPNARKDAECLRDMLVARGFGVELLTGSDAPSRQQLIEKLKSIDGIPADHPFLFYFAGHGEQHGELMLHLINGERNAATDVLLETELLNHLRRDCGASNCMVMLDACRTSGQPMRDSGALYQKILDATSNVQSPKDKYIEVAYSCQSGQSATEAKPFTRYAIDALENAFEDQVVYFHHWMGRAADSMKLAEPETTQQPCITRPLITRRIEIFDPALRELKRKGSPAGPITPAASIFPASPEPLRVHEKQQPGPPPVIKTYIPERSTSPVGALQSYIWMAIWWGIGSLLNLLILLIPLPTFLPYSVSAVFLTSALPVGLLILRSKSWGIIFHMLVFMLLILAALATFPTLNDRMAKYKISLPLLPFASSPGAVLQEADQTTSTESVQ